MNELEAFYSDLSDGGACANTGSCSSFWSDLNEIPSLLGRRRKTFVKSNWNTEIVTMLCRPSELRKNTWKRRLNRLNLPCFLACVWKFVGWKSKLCLWVRRAFKFTETGVYNFSWNERKRQKANKELASNILAKRLENVIPEIIHFDQSVFVKGITIFDAIRTMDGVIEHTMNRDILGTLAAIDFEKALDVSGKGI